MISAAHFMKELSLAEITPSKKLEWDIRSADLNRPGMQFCGFYDYFAYERPQVIGKVEMAYLHSISAEKRYTILQQYFTYDMPCIICCRGMMPPKELTELAEKAGIGVYLSDQVTTKLSNNVLNYLNRMLAPHTRKHGVLVDVYGVGILLTGDSGVGKSEAALELIKRGHQLVADDVVDICRIAENRLIGECPEMIRHLMEIRGIGLIDIKAMYGVSAVSMSKSIDLVIDLQNWDETIKYDRLGLEEDHISILGVNIPKQTMPVKPGRNLAIIIEVAARDLILKRMGYHTAQEFAKRLNSIYTEQ